MAYCWSCGKQGVVITENGACSNCDSTEGFSFEIDYVSEHGVIPEKNYAPRIYASTLHWPDEGYYTPHPQMIARGVNPDWEDPYLEMLPYMLVQNCDAERYFILAFDINEIRAGQLTTWDNGDNTFKLYVKSGNSINWCAASVETDGFPCDEKPSSEEITHLMQPVKGSHTSGEGEVWYMRDVDGQIGLTKATNTPTVDWKIIWASSEVKNYCGPGTVYDYGYTPEFGEIDCALLIDCTGDEDGGSDDLLPQMEAEGYTFKGWSLNGEMVEGNYPITGDVTLTAVWEANAPAEPEDHTLLLVQGFLCGLLGRHYFAEHSAGLPIKWDTADVVDNPRFDGGDAGEVVLVSDWYAKTEDDMWDAVGILTVTIGEEKTSIPVSLVMGDGKAFIGMYIFGDFKIGVISVPEDNYESNDMIAPKRGLYVTDIAALMGADAHCEFRGVEKPVMFFDEFPIDLKLNSSSLSMFANSINLVTEDGTNNGSILKISDMAPTLDDLNSKYNTSVGYSIIDGVLTEPAESLPCTWNWYGEPDESFVVDNENYFWVVYEEKTITAGVFDAQSIIVSAHVTPGIYLSDKACFALVLTLILMTQNGGEDSDYSNEMMRLCIGTAEDAEQVLKDAEALAGGGAE